MIDELKQWEYDRGYEKGKTDALHKIRAEIQEVYYDRPRTYNHSQRTELFCEVMKIIDKYKAQTEQVGNTDRLEGGESE